jgi:hypothetical protein
VPKSIEFPHPGYNGEFLVMLLVRRVEAEREKPQMQTRS